MSKLDSETVAKIATQIQVIADTVRDALPDDAIPRRGCLLFQTRYGAFRLASAGFWIGRRFRGE